MDQDVTFLTGMRNGKLLLEPLPDIGIARNRIVEVHVHLGILGKAIGTVIPLGAYQGIDIAPLQLVDLLNVLRNPDPLFQRPQSLLSGLQSFLHLLHCHNSSPWQILKFNALHQRRLVEPRVLILTSSPELRPRPSL